MREPEESSRRRSGTSCHPSSVVSAGALERLVAQAEVPRRLGIFGGGVIGCESASIFQRFGGDVTIIELLPNLLAQEDGEASAELITQFRRRGITLHLETRSSVSSWWWPAPCWESGWAGIRVRATASWSPSALVGRRNSPGTSESV